MAVEMRETVAEFLDRFLVGSNADYVLIRIMADDMLPFKGNKAAALKWLEKHPLYFHRFEMVDYNNINIYAVFTACK